MYLKFSKHFLAKKCGKDKRDISQAMRKVGKATKVTAKSSGGRMDLSD